jgi:hypothetical protein
MALLSPGTCQARAVEVAAGWLAQEAKALYRVFVGGHVGELQHALNTSPVNVLRLLQVDKDLRGGKS